eukprot:1093122-Amphidinium_carterae.1
MQRIAVFVETLPQSIIQRLIHACHDSTDFLIEGVAPLRQRFALVQAVSQSNIRHLCELYRTSSS